MIDPMLATGGSAVAALDLLAQAGARDIRMICIVAAPEGVELVERHHPGRARSTRRRSIAGSTSTSSSSRGSAISAIACTARYDMARTPHRRPTRPSCPRRFRSHPRDEQVAHGADLHRAEQDPRARLPARRDHGPADVRRGDLPAADGRGAVAGHRQPDGGDPRVVHRSRRDAAVDAGRAQHRDDRCAAARVRGRGRARVRPLSRRRHRELHAVSRYRARAGARAARPTGMPRERS